MRLLLLHVAMAYAIYIYEPASKIICVGILVFWIIYIVKNDNKNNEALMAAAYISGAEVFFRMTDGMYFYETGKYMVIVFLFIGMIYKGASAKSTWYWIYMLILTPGIVVASITLDYEVDFHEAIAFNLSGPISLGFSAVYCYYKKITTVQFNYVLLMLLLPIISNMVYLYLYTPGLEVALVSGANSNYITSGGYGPNQIATVLGLGAFVLCARLFIIKNKTINAIDMVLFALMSYRAIITFSRGGVLTGLICIVCFIVILYYKQTGFEQVGSRIKLILLGGVTLITWIFTSAITNNLINYRYTNRNAAGQMEADFGTGRLDLILTELAGFYRHPIIGVGVGKAKEFRSELTGAATASHNEVTRLLAEHGILGIAAILILIFVPVLFWFKFKNNYYFLAFMAFWFLTINHSAMRIALPGFVYGLALLYIVDEEKITVYR